MCHMQGNIEILVGKYFTDWLMHSCRRANQPSVRVSHGLVSTCRFLLCKHLDVLLQTHKPLSHTWETFPARGHVRMRATCTASFQPQGRVTLQGKGLYGCAVDESVSRVTHLTNQSQDSADDGFESCLRWIDHEETWLVWHTCWWLNKLHMHTSGLVAASSSSSSSDEFYGCWLPYVCCHMLDSPLPHLFQHRCSTCEKAHNRNVPECNCLKGYANNSLGTKYERGYNIFHCATNIPP